MHVDHFWYLVDSVEYLMSFDGFPGGPGAESLGPTAVTKLYGPVWGSSTTSKYSIKLTRTKG